MMDEMDCAPGVRPLTDAVLGGLAVEAVGEGLGPDTVRFTPSVTEARGFAVVEDLSADAPASGEATEARGVGLEIAGLEVGVGALAAVAGALVAVVAAPTFAPGARDCRRVAVPGAGGGGIALEAAEAEAAGLEAAVVGFVAGAVVVAFLRALVADRVFPEAAAPVALVAVGAAFTVPDPNVPELMIYAAARRQH